LCLRQIPNKMKFENPDPDPETWVKL